MVSFFGDLVPLLGTKWRAKVERSARLSGKSMLNWHRYDAKLLIYMKSG